MSDDGWRTSVRWVVAHPTEAKVLLAGWDGAARLPGSEHPGRVWTAEPGEVVPGLRDLLGADAVLLRCLAEHEDPTTRVQRATLLAVPRAVAALPDGLAWAGTAELAGAGDDAGDDDDELRDRLRAVYLPAWAPFEPPERLERAFRLAAPLAALHHAVSYRSIVAGMTPPVEPHLSRSTAWWLRQVLAGLS